MSSPSRPRPELKPREICVLALMGALIFAQKVAFSGIPNVNLNTVLILLTTVFFGWRALCSVLIYVMLEGLVYGGNSIFLWWFSYLYIWPLLVAICMLFRRNDSVVVWAVIGGIYGLVFGPLMYLTYFAVNGGWQGFFAMWVSGLLFDVAHCVSNFVFTLVLYRPLYRVMERFLGRPPCLGATKNPEKP